jgi:type II pantothenate kinase
MIGVDSGGSCTKIVCLGANNDFKSCLFQSTADAITHFFTSKDADSLSQFAKSLTKWCVVGGGSLKYSKLFESLPIPPTRGDELKVAGIGVAHILKFPDQIQVYGDIAKLGERYVIVAMGTGVSFSVNEPGVYGRHIAGSAFGGGTLMCLAKLILNVTDFDQLLKMAAGGNTSELDLFVSDIAEGDYGAQLPQDVVASSFAKVALMDKRPADKDIAAGLLEMIGYAIGSHVSTLCAAEGIETAVFIGGFLDVDGIIATSLVKSVTLFGPGITIIVPKRHQYIGALGAALSISE